MRSGNHIRHSDKRRILRRFFRKRIESARRRDGPTQRFGESSLVDQFASRAIDESRALLHFRDAAASIIFSVEPAERRVQRNQIGLPQNFVERNQLDFQLPERPPASQTGHTRVLSFRVREPAAPLRCTHAAQADQSERFSAHLCA